VADPFPHEVELSVLADPVELAEVAAASVAEEAGAAIAARGRFLLCLAGGSTPRALYERLAAEPWSSRVDWAQVHVAWGDERAVPPDDDASNYRMAREALLDHVTIPARQVHRIRGDVEPSLAAIGYEQILRGLLGEADGAGAPIAGFDLVLLGLGADGHTASLFPGRPTLQEASRWVVADEIDGSGWRITLTPLCLNAAGSVVFLVAGAGKADALRAALDGPSTAETAPSRAIRPRGGRSRWLVDAAAASGLKTLG
jgi:6-phosphogluconolactonase